MTDTAPPFPGPITFDDIDASTLAREDADTLAREGQGPAATSPNPGAWHLYLNRMLPPVAPYSAAWA